MGKMKELRQKSPQIVSRRNDSNGEDDGEDRDLQFCHPAHTPFLLHVSSSLSLSWTITTASEQFSLCVCSHVQHFMGIPTVLLSLKTNCDTAPLFKTLAVPNWLQNEIL